MICSSADLLRQWRAEREKHAQSINDLRSEVVGVSLTQAQRLAAIDHHIGALVDIDSLIADFSLCEPFPIMFDPSNAQAEPIVRRRFTPNALETA